MSEEQTKIEIENEDNETETEEPKTSAENVDKKRLTINRKKVAELTEAEKQQLIADAQNGFENQYYTVKLFKNGKCKINLKKQTKAQQVIDEANEYHAPSEHQIKRYYTDNQLLMEHIINLETSFNKLHSKHKKLKKRYNELEGYLYNGNGNDSSSDEDENDKPKQESKPIEEKPIEPQQEKLDEPKPIEEIQQQQQFRDASSISQQPYIQRRYVRSWRQLGNQ